MTFREDYHMVRQVSLGPPVTRCRKPMGPDWCWLATASFRRNLYLLVSRLYRSRAILYDRLTASYVTCSRVFVSGFG